MNIDVTALSGPSDPPHLGRLRFGALEFECALGRNGLVTSKREGDGGTPIGSFSILELRYRPDRIKTPVTTLPLKQTTPSDGWCDAPEDKRYNQPVTLPYPASAEAMWRDDHLYDLVMVLDYNFSPVRPFAGSAIFFHLANEEAGKLIPTEGCVALRKPDMLQLLPQLTRETKMRIG